MASGGQVVDTIRVPLRSPDFAPFLQRVRDASPQAVFVFIPSMQAGSFARQFVERGLDKTGIAMIGPGDVTDDQLLPSMGDAVLGTVTAHFYSAAHASPANAEFTEAYRKQTGGRANFMAVSGYDGMHVIYEALKKTAGSIDGNALVSAMKGERGRVRAGRSRSIATAAMSCTISISARSRGWPANCETSNSRLSKPLRTCGSLRSETGFLSPERRPHGRRTRSPRTRTYTD